MKNSSDLLLLFAIFFCCCTTTSSEKKHNVHGDFCKIWLLYDEKYLPIVLCFDNIEYQDYKIKNNGRLTMRSPFVYSETIFRGGKWAIQDGSLLLNDYITPKQSLLSDTIYIDKDRYLLNITNKFFVKECTCKNLNAIFKGGQIDSIKTILNYRD